MFGTSTTEIFRITIWQSLRTSNESLLAPTGMGCLSKKLNVTWFSSEIVPEAQKKNAFWNLSGYQSRGSWEFGNFRVASGRKGSSSPVEQKNDWIAKTLWSCYGIRRPLWFLPVEELFQSTQTTVLSPHQPLLWRVGSLTAIWFHYLQIIVQICNVNFIESSYTQAILPVSKGGIGIASASQIALPAFLASATGAKCALSCILPEDYVDASFE